MPVKIYKGKIGVYLVDSKQQVYSCLGKSKKWQHQVFYFFLDFSVVNAHILETRSPHSATDPTKTFKLN